MEAPDVAASASASLSDPAKLATLAGDRAANPRLKKAICWLVEARSHGRTLEQTFVEAQRINGNNGKHGALVRDSLIRNVTIADRLGCTMRDNLDLLRRGNSPFIMRRPYWGEIAEVDHIIPVGISAERENEFANLAPRV